MKVYSKILLSILVTIIPVRIWAMPLINISQDLESYDSSPSFDASSSRYLTWSSWRTSPFRAELKIYDFVSGGLALQISNGVKVRMDGGLVVYTADESGVRYMRACRYDHASSSCSIPSEITQVSSTDYNTSINDFAVTRRTATTYDVVWTLGNNPIAGEPISHCEFDTTLMGCKDIRQIGTGSRAVLGIKRAFYQYLNVINGIGRYEIRSSNLDPLNPEVLTVVPAPTRSAESPRFSKNRLLWVAGGISDELRTCTIDAASGLCTVNSTRTVAAGGQYEDFRFFDLNGNFVAYIEHSRISNSGPYSSKLYVYNIKTCQRSLIHQTGNFQYDQPLRDLTFDCVEDETTSNPLCSIAVEDVQQHPQIKGEIMSVSFTPESLSWTPQIFPGCPKIRTNQ